MSQRGFTLLEVLVAAATLSVVLAGAVAFYLSAVRVDQQNSAQVFLQRQATLIIDEMSKQIHGATGLQITGCGGGPATSLQVTNSRGVYCFRRAVDASGALTGFVEDRPDGGGGTWNLLSGAPVTLSVTSGNCPDDGGFCPSEVRHNVNNCLAGAAITLRLRAPYPGTPSSYQTMTFTSTIAGHNLPIPVPPGTPCP